MIRVSILMLIGPACSSAPPAVLGEVAAFTLTDQEGQPFGSEDLVGQPWVANFIFTRCPTICPTFTVKMADLQRQAGDLDWHMVSFSVDPEYDTPERMKAFAARHGADFRNWSFLTGSSHTIRTVVVESFKIAMGRDPKVADEVMSIFHGTHFVLVDDRQRIRAYHNHSDASAVRNILRDARSLQREL